jgi:hypothetical protein
MISPTVSVTPASPCQGVPIVLPGDDDALPYRSAADAGGKHRKKEETHPRTHAVMKTPRRPLFFVARNILTAILLKIKLPLFTMQIPSVLPSASVPSFFTLYLSLEIRPNRDPVSLNILLPDVKVGAMGKSLSEILRTDKRARFPAVCAGLLSLMLMLAAGCDMLTSDIPPEKLPPVPEKCQTLSTRHKNALTLAYSSAEASRMQVARVANEFAQCMQDEGLSRAEAKGILRKNEAEAQQEAEKGGPGAGDVYVQ